MNPSTTVVLSAPRRGGLRGGAGLEDMFGETAVLLQTTSPTWPVVQHGSIERISAVASLPALASPSALFRAWNGTAGRVFAWPGPSQQNLRIELRPAKHEVEPLFQSGFSIYVMELDAIVPELATTCRRLERDLGVPAGSVVAEAFCSCAGSGALPHFDDTDTINVQLIGDKTWSFADNEAVRSPPRGLVLGAEPHPELLAACERPLPRSMPAGATRVVAGPGTAIFVPNGILHTTKVSSDSFALLFTLTRSTAGDRIARRVRRRLRAIPILRAGHLERRGTAEDRATAIAAELRRLADTLEGERARLTADDDRRLALRRGVELAPRGETTFVVTTNEQERVVDFDWPIAVVLSWVADRTTPFTTRDVIEGSPRLRPAAARKAIRRLIAAGLVERRPS